ncbi:hypothetical protein GA830_13385 [Mesorhizobium sp. NBSH29]|uniref:DUF6105 family protein n=1 Tax=Mesorhizobium sp. NBSH29 TaxID=2654249 RepID=UPI0018965C73|nr:DUF6105 family protein [Mesorhizobium sp. NBSH29]QPC87629.1 hypothetical protein GA830_13385 [Mesorhizobium sp. NBSH29]
MLRALFGLWLAPIILFWGWYFLSVNDINFGFIILSRRLHDLLFELYGQLLGIDPEIIPGLVARACVFDGFLVSLIIAYRRRKPLLAWARNIRERYLGDGPARST